MNPSLHTDPEQRIPATCRGLLWSFALALLAGLLVWELRGGPAGAAAVQSAEVSPQALGSGPEKPDFTLDFDVDDPPAPQPVLSLLYRCVAASTVISARRSFRCGAPLPARAPPLPLA